MTNIALYARSGQNKLYAGIGRLMEQRGIRTCYIVQNRREEKIVRSYGVRGSIYNLTEYIRQNWNNPDCLNRHTIAAIERTYSIDSIWSIFYTDRFLIKYDRDDAGKFIKLHVTFFEDLIEKEKCRFLINEGVAIFSSYMFMLMGDKLDCFYLGLSRGRNFTREKFFFLNDPYSHNYTLDKIYQTNDFDQSDIRQAEEFIKTFRTGSVKPGYMKVHGRKPRLSPGFAVNLAKYLISLRDPVDKYDYERWRERGHVYLYPIRNYFRYQFQRFVYKQPREGEAFYLFPLHFQPESSTLVWAPNFEKQLFAVDQIAKKLPGDVTLYVKEHYSHLGHREPGFYKKLRSYPSVRLIDPWIDSHDLIKKSLGVITLTGTAGWEAMLFGKPVFLLGRVFYDTFKYVNCIENINDLTTALRQSQNGSGPPADYDKELTRYVAAYLKSFHDGNYSLADHDVTDDNNMTRLTDNILAEVDRLRV